MVAELPGFGLAPGEEDKGNESEPELETSKMVQVCYVPRLSLDDLKVNQLVVGLTLSAYDLMFFSEGGKQKEEEVRGVPVHGFIPRSMARSDQEGLQGADANPEEDGAADHGREGRGGNGKDWVGQDCCFLVASSGETQGPKINWSKSSCSLPYSGVGSSNSQVTLRLFYVEVVSILTSKVCKRPWSLHWFEVLLCARWGINGAPVCGDSLEPRRSLRHTRPFRPPLPRDGPQTRLRRIRCL